MSQLRLSDQLLAIARARLKDQSVRNEANLRRATSDLYFALFHAVCEALVEPLGGSPDNAAFVETYRNLYRQLDHGFGDKRCRNLPAENGFSPPLHRFARLFVVLRYKREQADYDPLEKFKVSVVRNDCESVEAALLGFWSVPAPERASFAFHLSIRSRNSQDRA